MAVDDSQTLRNHATTLRHCFARHKAEAARDEPGRFIPRLDRQMFSNCSREELNMCGTNEGPRRHTRLPFGQRIEPSGAQEAK